MTRLTNLGSGQQALSPSTDSSDSGHVLRQLIADKYKPIAYSAPANVYGTHADTMQYGVNRVFNNGAWVDVNSLAGNTPYYIDQSMVVHAGADLGNGKLWFPQITPDRTGTAGIQWGFADSNSPWSKANLANGTYNGQAGFTVNKANANELQANLKINSVDNGQFAKKDDGGLLGSLAPALGLASFVPGLQFLAPIAAGLNVAQGVSSGNWGQALGGALGLPGVSNLTSGLSGWVGNTLGTGAQASSAITNGLIGGGLTAAGGGSFKDALTSGLLTGSGAYGASQVADYLKSAGITDPSVIKALSSGTKSLISSGGNLTSGALSGLGSYGSSLASPYLQSAQNSINSLFSGTPTQSNGNTLANTANQAATSANTGGTMADTNWYDSLFGNLTSSSNLSDPTIYNLAQDAPATSSGIQDYLNYAAQNGGLSGTDWLSALGLGNGGVTGMGTGSAADGALASASSGNWLTSALNALASGGSGTKLLAAGLGGLLGGVNGSSQTGTQTTTTAPWASQQPYLLDLFNKASQAQQASQGTNALQTGAIANASNLANSGNALTSAATNTIGSAINGTLKNPYAGMNNPYLQGAIDNANTDVTRAMMPAMDQANRQSGSFGNSGVADTYSKNMADAYSRNATGMRMTDYTNQQNLAQQGIQNQLNASFNSTGFNANNLSNAANQFNLGTTAQQYPLTSLEAYKNLVGGGGYGATSSSPIYTNPYANALGGAAMGSSIYSNLFNNKTTTGG